MENRIHISELRKELPSLHRKLKGRSGEVVVTRYNRPVMVVLSWEQFSAMRKKAEEANRHG